MLPADLEFSSAVILLLTSFVTSAISATFGLGGGVAMLIALLSFTPPVMALPLHGIIQIGSNAGRAAMLRMHVMIDIVWWFVPGILIGVLVASFVFVSLSATLLQTILAVFIIWSVWTPKFKARPIDKKYYFIVGSVSSFGAMFLGATGPLLGAFLTPDRYGRDATVATHATCMMVQHIVKVLAFGFLGFVFIDWIALLAGMLLCGYAGTLFGGQLLCRIPEARFRIIFKLVLSALAVRLLVKAIMS